MAYVNVSYMRQRKHEKFNIVHECDEQADGKQFFITFIRLHPFGWLKKQKVGEKGALFLPDRTFLNSFTKS
jgi:hypothetical protein